VWQTVPRRRLERLKPKRGKQLKIVRHAKRQGANPAYIDWFVTRPKRPQSAVFDWGDEPELQVGNGFPEGAADTYGHPPSGGFTPQDPPDSHGKPPQEPETEKGEDAETIPF
jgi:hypothetical protein